MNEYKRGDPDDQREHYARQYLRRERQWAGYGRRLKLLRMLSGDLPPVSAIEIATETA
jgi:hypothetical protein